MIEPVFESIDTLSQAEFAEWVSRRPAHDENHYELLNGRIVMNPPAGYPHGAIESSIGFVLGRLVRGREIGKLFGSSQGFDLPSGDTVEADYTFVSAERWNAIESPPEDGQFLRVVPDVVIEILSRRTASRDRGEKKAIYARNLVREYWLVDPRRREITVFLHDGQAFDRGTSYGEDASFRSASLGGTVSVADCFDY